MSLLKLFQNTWIKLLSPWAVVEWVSVCVWRCVKVGIAFLTAALKTSSITVSRWSSFLRWIFGGKHIKKSWRCLRMLQSNNNRDIYETRLIICFATQSYFTIHAASTCLQYSHEGLCGNSCCCNWNIQAGNILYMSQIYFMRWHTLFLDYFTT